MATAPVQLPRDGAWNRCPANGGGPHQWVEVPMFAGRFYANCNRDEDDRD